MAPITAGGAGIFIAGIILGILLTFSLLNHVDFNNVLNSSGSDSSTSDKEYGGGGGIGSIGQKGSGIEGNSKWEYNVNWVETPEDTNKKVVAAAGTDSGSSQGNQYLLKPIDVEEAPSAAAGSVTRGKQGISQQHAFHAAAASMANGGDAAVPRWTPGKEGFLSRLSSKVTGAVGVIDVEENNEFNSILPGSQADAAEDNGQINAALVGRPDRPDRQRPAGGRGGGRGGRGAGSGGGRVGGGRLGGRVGSVGVDTSFSSGNSTEIFDLYDAKGNRFNPSDALMSFTEPVLLPFPPLPAYHAQTNSYSPVFVPSLQSIQAARAHPLVTSSERQKPLPNMTLQRAVFEPSNLKLHLCNAQFEAYSAAYLTTKEHIIAGKLTLCIPCCSLCSCLCFSEERKL
jgi:hypothetical protein